MRLLVVEDDAETAGYVLRGLREHGHVADHAKDGHDGLMLAGEGNTMSLSSTACCPNSTGWRC